MHERAPSPRDVVLTHHQGDFGAAVTAAAAAGFGFAAELHHEGLHGRGPLLGHMQGLQGELDGSVGVRLPDDGVAALRDDANLLAHALRRAGHEHGERGHDPQHGDEGHATRRQRAAGDQRRPPMVNPALSGSVGASAAMRTTKGGHSPETVWRCSSIAPGSASRGLASGVGHCGAQRPLRASR